MPRRCALGCTPTKGVRHNFPNPDIYPDQFKAWVKIVSGKTECGFDYEKQKREVVCDRHFVDKDRICSNRLNALAIPSLFLPCVPDEMDTQNPGTALLPETETITLSIQPTSHSQSAVFKNIDNQEAETGNAASVTVTESGQSSSYSQPVAVCDVSNMNVDVQMTGTLMEAESGISTSVTPTESGESTSHRQKIVSATRTPSDMNKSHVLEECRACLRKLEGVIRQELFQPWHTPWACQGAIIANDLAELANIEILKEDSCSKVICLDCYKKLEDACLFILAVRKCDSLLKNNCPNTVSDKNEIDTSWPKPIIVNQHLNEVIENNVEVEVKQEVLSEDEYDANDADQHWEEPKLDIKIEPEEIVAPQISFEINDAYSLAQGNEEEKQQNGTRSPCEELLDSTTIKQEPVSSEESNNPPENNQKDTESVDCILCMKHFNCVTGLKAHVIAQHSYGTVKRKSSDTDDRPLPPKKLVSVHICVTCRRTFRTRTDLMVHETSHEHHVCYACDSKFLSFRQLSRHSARCRQRRGLRAPPLRTYPKQQRAKSDSIVEKINPASKLLKAPEDPLNNAIEVHKTPENSKDEQIMKTVALQLIEAVKQEDTSEMNGESQHVSADTEFWNTEETQIKNDSLATEDKPLKQTKPSENHSATEDNQQLKLIDSIKEEKEDSILEDIIPSPTDPINRNMEVHLAINPIGEEDSDLIDSKVGLVDVKLDTDDGCGQKLVSVINEDNLIQ